VKSTSQEDSHILSSLTGSIVYGGCEQDEEGNCHEECAPEKESSSRVSTVSGLSCEDEHLAG